MKKWLIVGLAALGAATQAGLVPVFVQPVVVAVAGALGVPLPVVT